MEPDTTLAGLEHGHLVRVVCKSPVCHGTTMLGYAYFGAPSGIVKFPCHTCGEWTDVIGTPYGLVFRIAKDQKKVPITR